MTTARPPARLVPRVVPSVEPWVAGEMFVSPHIEERRRGFAILFGSEAVRRSTLTSQLLASRVDEPDLSLRAQIVQALADYFEVRGGEYRYPAEVRAVAASHLRKFERPHLLALLEVHSAARENTVRLAPDSTRRRSWPRRPGSTASAPRRAAAPRCWAWPTGGSTSAAPSPSMPTPG